MDSDTLFTEYRPVLFTVAYEILGSATDAEDVLQDSYLRWRDVDSASVDHPRTYLVTIVTRQALNLLRARRRRREEYVGSWLPEPVRTDESISADGELADSVSMAMLLVLETLSPTERAVFVLHDVFGYSYREIAEVVHKTEGAVRQIAHRAREHVRSRRKRSEPDSAATREIVRRFLLAAQGQDLQALMELLAPDVVEISDGGGLVWAARKPVRGRERVAQFALGLARLGGADVRIELASCNGLPSVLVSTGAGLDTVLLFELADNLVRGIYAVRNPRKLSAARRSWALTREGIPRRGQKRC